MTDEPTHIDDHQIKTLLHRQKFKNGIQKLRKKWSIPTDGLTTGKRVSAWRDQLSEEDTVAIKADVYTLTVGLGLSERWQQGIYEYLKTGSLSALIARPPGEIRFKQDGSAGTLGSMEKHNVNEVWIRVFADSTEQEVLDDFRYAKSMFDNTPKKKQKPRYFDRNLKAWELRKTGLTHTEIARKLTDENYGVFNSDDVAKMIRRIKKTLE
ncbi:MAG TPA: hypothetical protein VFT87_05640 [Candidatus Saccharimonadales bacterium]|nr:hypothetical protein [Candidatus Saccharimonadales bacterium]